MASKTFEAVLGGEEGARPAVAIPFDVAKVFGSARPKVKATVNGVELRTTVAVYGGQSYVGFRQEIRAAAGIAMGDRIKVKLELDTATREVAVPGDLARALAGDREAKAAFDRLSFTHQKEYVQWIESAKKQETRARRIAKALDMLGAGAKHP